MLSLRLGISAVFDLTGATIFRVVRPMLPEPPARATRPDPFVAASETIMAAHREVVGQSADKKAAQRPVVGHVPKRAIAQAPDKSGVTLPE
jgi:hypothetical protein